jgi:anti-sigma regulatory factor (Ser/Thr protein kinase)
VGKVSYVLYPSALEGHSIDLAARLPATLGAPRQARHLLGALAEEIDTGLLDDVRLLVNELVTNSVKHAGLDDGQRIGLSVQTAITTVRVEVSDPGPGFEPDRHSGASDPSSGWGLLLVERLSDRWGVKRSDLTSVWFEIDR